MMGYITGMRRTITCLALAFGLIACSGEETDGSLQPCEDTYTTCEWAAHRSSSIFSAYFAVRDCSWDYGVCIGKQGEEDCETWCTDLTWVPSECIYGCEAYGPVSTSSVGLGAR